MTFFTKKMASAFALTIVAVALTACSTSATREGLTPQALTVAKQHQHSVRVQTAGGAETGALDSSNIENADLKGAIEDAIAQSKLFKAVVRGNDGADYELNVSITSMSKPLLGLTFTVEMETAWSLVKVSDRSVVMRKSVKAAGSATMSDALVAVTRLRMAVENAARENITQGLQSIAAQAL